jgi:preprotein translocase subunit SecA
LLFKRNKDYLVQGGKVVIVDEFTGRLMPGRRWSEGLHQAVEAKENVKVEPENVTYATITIQNYFRMYEKLAGMTGTALTEAEEFNKIYKLEVLPIPTNLEYQAYGKNAPMRSIEDKDESGYKYTYYCYSEDVEKTPVFFKRKDFPDVVFRTEQAKLRAIVKEIIKYHILGRPMLVGTTSVEHSDRLSDLLSAENVRRLLQVQLIRDTWMELNNREMIEQNVPDLAFLNVPLADLNITQMRKYARTININSVNPQDSENAQRLLKVLELPIDYLDRFMMVCQAGVVHRVLNARKHDEEAMIINNAGSFGAVTIATNMAGRGVDIKLGGEISEELYADVARVLKRYQYDPYSMNNEEKREALLKLANEDFDIYAESVKAFLQSMSEMEKVRELGGLHVIGSERHEARRIDNQLRGRSSRQGDPGSSRFFLSLEDELMRLFGGLQVEGLMKRLNVEENIPIESGIVGRLVEQSQERVEGSNFDVRKHLLEYDDVLNMQRQRIYDQRDMAFTKNDLTEDVFTMLEADIENRVNPGLEDEEGPWKLVAYLSDIQPSIDFESIFYPNLTLRILADDIAKSYGGLPIDPEQAKEALLKLSEDSLNSEFEHLMLSAQNSLDRIEEALETQKIDRYDSLDSFIAGLEDRSEIEELNSQKLVQELSNIVRTPLRLSSSQISELIEGSGEIEDEIRKQIEDFLTSLNVLRIVGAFSVRIDNLELKPKDLQGQPWSEVVNALLDAIENALDQRKSQLLGNNGQLFNDLDTLLKPFDRNSISVNDLYRLMINLVQGSKLAFDRKTHRQVRQKYQRINYVFSAAKVLQKLDPASVKDYILTHLEGAIGAMQEVWGIYELNRLKQSQVSISQLDESSTKLLKSAFEPERYSEIDKIMVNELDSSSSDLIQKVLGERVCNEIYREVLLSVISQMWVEYLTRMEGLRVSIGMEAYAQRDPLVQYKSQASELFSNLLVDIRSALVNRMFTYRPSQKVSASIEKEKVLEQVLERKPQSLPETAEKTKKKRRRH